MTNAATLLTGAASAPVRAEDFAEMNVADTVARSRRAHPDKPALVAGSLVVTWAELDRDVDAVANGLRSLGLARGDRVALLLGNTPAFASAYFGTLRAGLVAVPLNTAYTATEVAGLLRDCDAQVAIGDLSTTAVVLETGLALTATVTTAPEPPPGTLTYQELLDRGRPLGRAATSQAGEDLAVLSYTSGTSGRPKGAMLSHRALLANHAQVGQITPAPVQTEDIVLLVLPLFHIYGLNTGLGAVAYHGATGVLVDRFDPVQALEVIKANRVSTLVGAPPMYVAWSMLPAARDSFGSVRLAISGAAPLPAAVLRRITEGTGRPVFEGYGLTETAPVVSSTLGSALAKPDSVGRPVPGVEVRLLDDLGAPVEDDDPGEVAVRGANLFSGYWPDGRDGPDADGWFATGDVGYFDDDGDLHLVDRRRELILVSGFNVYPREVEDVLQRHPQVRECAVLGIPHPYTGEAVKALVVLEPDATVTGTELIEFCARSLARFKCPTAVELVAALPHSATGKVSKGRLREAGS